MAGRKSRPALGVVRKIAALLVTSENVPGFSALLSWRLLEGEVVAMHITLTLREYCEGANAEPPSRFAALWTVCNFLNSNMHPLTTAANCRCGHAGDRIHCALVSQRSQLPPELNPPAAAAPFRLTGLFVYAIPDESPNPANNVTEDCRNHDERQ